MRRTRWLAAGLLLLGGRVLTDRPRKPRPPHCAEMLMAGEVRVRTLRAGPKVVKALAQMASAVWDKESEVDLGFKRLVAYMASRTHGCSYSMAHAAEAAHQIRRYLQDVEPDPQRLEALERRLRTVHDAARRLRTDPEGLPDALSARRDRLAELGGDESIEVLRGREAQATAAFGEAGRALSAKRREAARRLGEEVARRLQGHAMEGGRLEVVLEPLAEPSAGGLEAVEFREI